MKVGAVKVGDVYVRTHALLTDDINAPMREVTLVTSVQTLRHGGTFLTWSRITFYTASIPTVESGHGDEEEMLRGAAMSKIESGNREDWYSAVDKLTQVLADHGHRIFQEATDSTLDRCPRCGGPARTMVAPESWVQCRWCGARTAMYSNLDKAIADWSKGVLE